MAGKPSLRDYQRDLVERLRNPDSSRIASKLGLQVGGECWLVDLADAGEVLPVPAISPVPLTRPWFKGVTSIRGMLYSVIDFPAFLGGTAVTLGEQARLLLIGERFRMGSALLVDRALGLRNPDRLTYRARSTQTPWLRAEYADTDGTQWKELDLPQLVQQPDFLSVGA
jgi:twitching motility protein PilI